jgi:hypothetical protein
MTRVGCGGECGTTGGGAEEGTARTWGTSDFKTTGAGGSTSGMSSAGAVLFGIATGTTAGGVALAVLVDDVETTGWGVDVPVGCTCFEA